MNLFIHGRLGHFLMSEAGADGGDAGGAAPAPAADPAAAPAQPAEPAGSLLGDQIQQPEPGATPDADKPNPDAPKPDEQEATGAPEAYEAFTMPEGQELDENALPMVQDLFKELGLPQDKAQQVLDKLLEIDAARQPTPEQQQAYQTEMYQKGIEALNAKWADECRALPDIGGDKFNESLEIASSVMVKFATPELRGFLNNSALGSNPEFFKFIHAIGSAMKDDTMEHGGEPSKGPLSLEQRLWPQTTN